MQRLILSATILCAGLATHAQADVIGKTYTSVILSSGQQTPAVIAFSDTATFTYEPDGGPALGGFYLQTDGSTTGVSGVVMTFIDGEERIGTGAASSTDLSFGPLSLSFLYGAANIGDESSGFFGYTFSIGSIPLRKAPKSKLK